MHETSTINLLPASRWPDLTWTRGDYRLEPLTRRRGPRSVRPGFRLHALVGLALRRTLCDQECSCMGDCTGSACACATLAAGGTGGGESSGPRGGFRTAGYGLDTSWEMWREGEYLAFGIVLLGRAASARPHVERAVQWIAATGLPDYSAGSPTWAAGRVGVGALMGLEGAGRAVTLEFASPIRLVRRGQPLRDVSLEDVVRDLAFRAQAWATHHEGRPCGDLWAELEPDVRRAAVVRSRQRWSDSQRHSSRQSKLVPTGGVLGSIELADVTPRLAGFLRLAVVSGIGKGATSGLGRVRISEGATQ